MCTADYSTIVIDMAGILVTALMMLLVPALHHTQAFHFPTPGRLLPTTACRVRTTRHVSELMSLSDARELTKVFNRMADKFLLLDVPGAGSPEMMQCCHGGCDNCNFSRIFDEMSSGRPKWVALYPYRKHADGRDHMAPWSQIFVDEAMGPAAAPSLRLSKEQFVQRFSALPCAGFSMGPPSSVPPDEPLAPETLEQLWAAMQMRKQSDLPGLGSDDMAHALADITGAEHGALFSEFVKVGALA